MAVVVSKGLVVLCSLLVLCLFPLSLSSQKKTSSAARREDIPYIKCQVCEKIAHQIYHQVKNKEAQISARKVPEFEIIEIVENVCDLKKEQADWILQIDIVQKGDKLELVEQGVDGMCNSKCKTIERACQEVIGYADTDVAEFVFKTNPTADLLTKFLCHDLSKACLVEPPPVPKDRTPGESFLAKPTGEAEMQKMLRTLEGMPGAPSMKMYSKEELLKNNFGDEESDEDDDEEDSFPTNLGKALKDEDSPKKDLKQRIMRGFAETGKKMKVHLNKASQRIRKSLKQRIMRGFAETGKKMKVHLNKASQRIRKWWRRKKTASKSPKKGKSDEL